MTEASKAWTEESLVIHNREHRKMNIRNSNDADFSRRKSQIAQAKAMIYHDNDNFLRCV